MIRLDESHDGDTLPAAVGDRIELVLPETATTGYRWEVDDATTSGLEILSSEAVPAPGTRPGAGGHRRVVARATSTGRAQLSLVLRRGWERPEAAAQRYAVILEVA